jgi:hypothetical protein
LVDGESVAEGLPPPPSDLVGDCLCGRGHAGAVIVSPSPLLAAVVGLMPRGVWESENGGWVKFLDEKIAHPFLTSH